MSIDKWQDEPGKTAIGKMGWPTWGKSFPDDGPLFRLFVHSGLERQIRDRGEWKFDGALTPDEALALLQKHAREWAEEQGIRILPVGQSYFVARTTASLMDHNRIWCGDNGWQDVYSSGNTKRGMVPEASPTYDEALIAAVNATETPDEQVPE